MHHEIQLMNKISYIEFPDYYAVCIKSDCPLTDNLRQLAMQVFTKQYEFVRIANPLLIQLSKQCEFYRSDVPQVASIRTRYALVRDLRVL